MEEAVGSYSGSQSLLLSSYRIKLNLQTNATCNINTSFYYSTIKKYDFSFHRKEITSRSAANLQIFLKLAHMEGNQPELELSS